MKHLKKFNEDFIFQVFGSKSSQDLDCMVIVDNIPSDSSRANTFRKSIQKSHELCDFYGEKIKEITNTDKVVNTNICVIRDGIVVDVFKGTPDEVNNSMYITYDFHKQWYPNQVERLVDRDIELKILRTCRVILSFISRTEYRTQVKQALRGDIYDKIKLIKSIDFSKINDLNKPSQDFNDYLKVMAFQLGQVFGLIDGVELYSKEDISKEYPLLSDFLFRRSQKSQQDLDLLNEHIQHFIMDIESIDFKKQKNFKKYLVN